MKKFICLLIIFVFTGCAAQSVTLSGGVSYTVNEARQIAFDGVAQKIDMSKYKEYFVDKNFEKNINALKNGKNSFWNRFFMYFSDDTYAVRYKLHSEIGYYYNKDGVLFEIDFIEDRDYPKRAIKYDKKGSFKSVILIISSDEQYIFDTNKKLRSHWIGKNCYNEKGELILTRE